jgi:hypothetical protein
MEERKWGGERGGRETMGTYVAKGGRRALGKYRRDRENGKENR